MSSASTTSSAIAPGTATRESLARAMRTISDAAHVANWPTAATRDWDRVTITGRTRRGRRGTGETANAGVASPIADGRRAGITERCAPSSRVCVARMRKDSFAARFMPMRVDARSRPPPPPGVVTMSVVGD